MYYFLIIVLCTFTKLVPNLLTGNQNTDLDNEGIRERGEETTLCDIVSPLSPMPFFCEPSERTRLARSPLKAFQAENGAEDVWHSLRIPIRKLLSQLWYVKQLTDLKNSEVSNLSIGIRLCDFTLSDRGSLPMFSKVYDSLSGISRKVRNLGVFSKNRFLCSLIVRKWRTNLERVQQLTSRFASNMLAKMFCRALISTPSRLSSLAAVL